MFKSLFNAPRAYPAFYAPYHDRLIQFYDGRDQWERATKDVPPGAKALFCVHWLHLEVFNGGFWQYFFNSTGVTAPEARNGFVAIGMPDVAEIVAKAMDRVGLPYPFEREARQAQTGPSDARLDFSDLDTAFYELADTNKVFRRTPKFAPFAERYAETL